MPKELYNDTTTTPTLKGKSAEIYKGYIEELKVISQDAYKDIPTFGSSAWENRIRQFYKKLLYDVFEEFKIKPPDGMEIYFAGSLGKVQATLHSDLDSFVIFQNEEDQKTTQPVFVALNNLLTRIFFDTNQLFPDPAGINPVSFGGTVDTLVEKIQEDMSEPVLMSVMSSKPILGKFELGEQLREKLKNDSELGPICSAQNYYSKALSFTGPEPEEQQADIKRDLIRPIDFILMGLREEFNLTCEDGSHLSASNTLNLLREKHDIPEEILDTIEEVAQKAVSIRQQLHYKAHKETEEINRASVEPLLKKVKQIQEFAQQRIAILNNPDYLKQKNMVEQLDNISKVVQNYKNTYNKSIYDGSIKQAVFYQALLTQNEDSHFNKKIITYAIMVSHHNKEMQKFLATQLGFSSSKEMCTALLNSIKNDIRIMSRNNPEKMNDLANKTNTVISKIVHGNATEVTAINDLLENIVLTPGDTNTLRTST